MNWYNCLRQVDLAFLAGISIFGFISFWGLTMGLVVKEYLGMELLFQNSILLLVWLATLMPYGIIGFYGLKTFTKERKGGLRK